VAISMLEHVGTDERPAAPGKAVQAIQALRGLLASEGRLVLTVPVGYNPAFDAALRGKKSRSPARPPCAHRRRGAMARSVPGGRLAGAL
jgi:hypothetical protein